MRKILAILSIGIIWVFLPMFVRAESNNLLALQEACHSKGLYPSDDWIDALAETWEEHPTYKCAFFISDSAINGALSDDIRVVNNVINYGQGYFAYWASWTQAINASANGGTYGPVNNQLLYIADSYAEANPEPINFDDIYYSPQIPIPTIDIYMGSDVNNPTSGQAVWNASMEFGDNSQYYIQYGYKASFPSYIDVGLASLRGDFSYNYYNYTSTNYIDIVNLQSLTTAVNQSKPASYFQEAWQAFYDDYLTQSLLPNFGTQVNAMSSSMLDDAKDYYIDYMLGQMPMYGNRLEVFARYFIIDEENNNRVVVGAWNHWSSKDGSRTKERPSNYIDNVALPGYINTNNDVNYQENEGSFDSVGETTGVPATIINNNYVPNYPDYPTIASYNKDNLLVSSIDKLNEVKGFFGEFNDFLNVTFVWVPDWIWALIGIGFSLSIIVFFLRML